MPTIFDTAVNDGQKFRVQLKTLLEARISTMAVSSASSLKTLQEKLTSSLASVGYSGKPVKFPAAVERNQKLLAFLEWTIEQTVPENFVSQEHSETFKKLRSEGKVLEGRALQTALSKLSSGTERPEDVEKEIEGIGDRAAALKGQLQTLNAVHCSLSDHYASLLHERDELSRQKSDMKRRCHEALEEARERYRNVDVAVEDLSSAVKELCGSHRRAQDWKPSSSDLHLLSDVSQDPYHQAEDAYLAQLVGYTKKQFFKGIAELAHSQAPDEEDYQFNPIDLDDSAQVILRGVSEEQYRQHQWELHRLQAVYPVMEMQHVNAVLAHRHAQAATVQAKQELDLLNHTPAGELEEDSLRRQVAERQQKVSELQAMLEGSGQDRLTTLLQEMAALQVTRVLHGDYDLKLARQDSFISKQDQVVSCLQSQRARHELLGMLYEVELRRHRDTHRLLATTEHHLTQIKEEKSQRTEVIQDKSLRKASSRTSLESTDKLAQELCALLGVKAEGVAPLLTQEGLLEAVRKLSQQVAMLEGVLAAGDTELRHLLDTGDSLTCQLEREVFCGSDKVATGFPVLCVGQYVEQCSRFTSLVNSLEMQVKQLIKDYEAKKKLLKTDPLLDTERKLFVYFFTNPAKLSEVLGDLAKRIDSVSLANK